MSLENLGRNINMKHAMAPDLLKKMNSRLLVNKLSKILFFLATLFGLVILVILITRVLMEGMSWINLDFITGKLSTQPDRAGIMGAILGTLWLMIVVAP